MSIDKSMLELVIDLQFAQAFVLSKEQRRKELPQQFGFLV
jgi:hypothetical protein